MTPTSGRGMRSLRSSASRARRIMAYETIYTRPGSVAFRSSVLHSSPIPLAALAPAACFVKFSLGQRPR